MLQRISEARQRDDNHTQKQQDYNERIIFDPQDDLLELSADLLCRGT
jgi:hypothetical protein